MAELLHARPTNRAPQDSTLALRVSAACITGFRAVDVWPGLGRKLAACFQGELPMKLTIAALDGIRVQSDHRLMLPARHHFWLNQLLKSDCRLIHL